MIAHGAVLHLHLLLAVISGFQFGVRATWRLGLQKSINSAFRRRARHPFEALMPAGGLTLTMELNQSTLDWLT